MFVDESLYGKRALKYIRVSTAEQAIKGFSLEAQEADLDEFVKAHYMVTVGTFIDAGKTARKNLHKREALRDMLEYVKRDEADIILFVRLDRWTRNIKDYWKVQEVLDAHNVQWKCTQEQYDTYSTNGRLQLNLKLAIAEDEADRTSDRIKGIQKNKVANGEVISGSLPYGLKIDRSSGRKRIAIDQDKIAITLDAFDHFLACQSRRKTRIYIGDKYGVHWTDQTFKAMIYNDLYAGEYRGNKDYCPAAVEKQKMNEMRRICETLHQHSRTGVHCYLFSGLARCQVCGNVMHGVADPLKSGGHTYYYRCSKHYNYHACTNNASIRESVIEEYLLQNVERQMKDYAIRYEITAKENKKPQAEKARIRAKLRKLKELYVNDLIDLKEYKKDYDAYTKKLEQLEEAPAPGANVEKINAFLAKDFKSTYDDLDREEKRTLWRSVIKAIYITEDKDVQPPVFL